MTTTANPEIRRVPLARTSLPVTVIPDPWVTEKVNTTGLLLGGTVYPVKAKVRQAGGRKSEQDAKLKDLQNRLFGKRSEKPSVPLPRESFRDIQVAQIDSPTRQPLRPGPSCGRGGTPLRGAPQSPQ